MHCMHCGTPILPDTHFCPQCGSAVAPPAPPPRSRPDLLRPRQGRMLGGVCAAFARTYGWNVLLIRVLMVVLVPLHLGLGFLGYLIAWILIPEEPYVLPAGQGSSPPPPVV